MRTTVALAAALALGIFTGSGVTKPGPQYIWNGFGTG